MERSLGINALSEYQYYRYWYGGYGIKLNSNQPYPITGNGLSN